MKNFNLETVKQGYCYGVGTAGNFAKIGTFGFSLYAVPLLHNKVISQFIPNTIAAPMLALLKLIPGVSSLPSTNYLIASINKSPINPLPDMFHLKDGISGALGLATSFFYAASHSEVISKNANMLAGGAETLVEDTLSLGLCNNPAGLFDGLL